ncbi:hypothetical protein [Neorhizobium alkalisoli]|uniref:hypothetical protein n=1 Tax=Neorhizobium alkalisoli TaxID=528178 RepID=UPI0011A20EBE|nr:hypothetical protein [Neorhizobium alkalisoli]
MSERAETSTSRPQPNSARHFGGTLPAFALIRQLQDPGLASGKFALVLVHPFTVCGVIYFLHNASKSVQVNFITSFHAFSVIYFLNRLNTGKFS